MGHGVSLRENLSKTGLSFLNLFWKNDKRRWDKSYAAGHWHFLDSLQQCPRHYVIAGMLRAQGPGASRVLDVGCGTGALVPHLPSNVAHYVGIDISSEAIRLCRKKHGDEAAGRRRSFEATSFEDFVPAERFQVIVFNEMLYYLPVPEIPEVVSRALDLLDEDGGTVIVSVHNRSLKRRRVWRKLGASLSSTESTEAVDLGSGESWRIRRYDIGLTESGAADA